MARGHAEALMPMVAEVHGRRRASLRRDLDLIAATDGPGSFTGVRIAIAAARGLALATGAKLCGTDSLTVMARERARERPARATAPSPSRSMHGAACSISVFMTRQGERASTVRC